MSLGLGLATHLIGRRLLQESVRILGARRIPVMPLKGIWLQQLVYSDPGERRITDVDILVPEARYPEALDALEAAGWALRGSNVSESALGHPDWPLPLDVHQRLYTRGAFCMPGEALFARGRLDRTVFDCDLVLPDPLDVFAHLVGHFVKSRGGRDTNSNELRDLPRVAARFGLDPSETARHLERCGLARACRYALQCVPALEDPAGFCRATLARLGDDPVGVGCAAVMLGLRSRFGVRSRAAAVPGFFLQPSLRRAVYSFMLRGWDRRLDRRSSAARSAHVGRA